MYMRQSVKCVTCDRFRTSRLSLRCVMHLSSLRLPTMKTTKKEKKKGKEKEEQTRPGNSKWSEADEALLVETMAEQKARTG